MISHVENHMIERRDYDLTLVLLSLAPDRLRGRPHTTLTLHASVAHPSRPFRSSDTHSRTSAIRPSGRARRRSPLTMNCATLHHILLGAGCIAERFAERFASPSDRRELPDLEQQQ